MSIFDSFRRRITPGAVKQPRKVSMIAVVDYPRELYSVYWEIRVNFVKGNWNWSVRLYPYVRDPRAKSPFADLAEGITADRDTADATAQQWLLDNMERFRRQHA